MMAFVGGPLMLVIAFVVLPKFVASIQDTRGRSLAEAGRFLVIFCGFVLIGTGAGLLHSLKNEDKMATTPPPQNPEWVTLEE